MTTRKSQLKVMGFAVLVAIQSVGVAQDANGGSEADDYLQAVMRVRSKSEKTIVKDEMSKRELCRQLAERFQRSSGKRIVVYEGYEQPLVLVQEDTASSPPRRGLDNGSISSFAVVSHSKVVDINGKTDSEVNDVMEKQGNVRLIAGAGQKAAHVVEDSLANDEAWPLNSNADLSGVTSGTRRAQFEQLEQLLVNKKLWGQLPNSLTHPACAPIFREVLGAALNPENCGDSSLFCGVNLKGIGDSSPQIIRNKTAPPAHLRAGSGVMGGGRRDAPAGQGLPERSA